MSAIKGVFIGAVWLLATAVLTGCDNPTPTPLPDPTATPAAAAPAPVAAAQTAVLEFLRTSAVECVPPRGASWAAAPAVVPAGYDAWEFTTGGCVMVVTAAHENAAAYHVSLRNSDLNFCWQAIVDGQGAVVRTGLAAETEPGPGNAAADYCTAQGYTYSITETDPSGNKCGYCIFPDGSRCKSWLYFYGECAPGDHPAEQP